MVYVTMDKGSQSPNKNPSSWKVRRGSRNYHGVHNAVTCYENRPPLTLLVIHELKTLADLLHSSGWLRLCCQCPSRHSCWLKHAKNIEYIVCNASLQSLCMNTFYWWLGEWLNSSACKNQIFSVHLCTFYWKMRGGELSINCMGFTALYTIAKGSKFSWLGILYTYSCHHAAFIGGRQRHMYTYIYAHRNIYMNKQNNPKQDSLHYILAQFIF